MTRHWTDLPEAHCDPTEKTSHVLGEVLAERARQDAKWGEQNQPSIPETSGPYAPEAACQALEIPTEERAKLLCEREHRRGEGTFAHIAVEELAEAVAAAGDVERRAELVQLAAVVVQWIEAIDRRVAKGGAK